MTTAEIIPIPGFFGKNRDDKFSHWDDEYGENNWQLAWEIEGSTCGFAEVFTMYVWSYIKYFQEHPEEADYIVSNYAYVYDKSEITPDQAFDPYALVNIPGLPNQFHHVAINLALQVFLGKTFQGAEPLQVRDGKPHQPLDEWPAGWQWGPGHIPVHNSNLLPKAGVEGWWEKGSIEELYQVAKVLLIFAEN